MKMRRISIKYVSFQSLDPLFRIIRDEPSFKVQLISIEDSKVVRDLLSYKGIKYKVLFASLSHSYVFRSKIVYLILEDEPFFRKRSEGKFIIYSKKYLNSDVSLCFTITTNEKIRYLQIRNPHSKTIKHIVRAHGQYKNLTELENLLRNNERERISPSLNYLESIIVFAMINNSRFKEIVNNVKAIDEKLNNSFLIYLTLNTLINKKIITKRRGIYKNNISRESIRVVCKKIGYDVDRL